jgi:hypothetical protein
MQHMADRLDSRGAIVVGDGNFGMNVVGASHCQSQIEHLVGGRTQMGYGVEPPYNRALFAALLLPELDNPYDWNVVRVIIRNVPVGYLERNVAKDFIAALALNHLTHAACTAAICDGWYRRPHDRDDDGNFGVRLDIVMPFHFRATKI